jgi:cephalosporin hydroxylase
MVGLQKLVKKWQVKGRLRQARQLLRAGNGAEALRVLEPAATLPFKVRGLQYLRGACLDKVGRHPEALMAYELELGSFPDNERAAGSRQALLKAFELPETQARGLARPWSTSLPSETLHRLQQSLHAYAYRGVPMLKNPFDMALYPLLLWDLKPRTILEIGSKAGGSALWFGDLLNNFGIDGHVHSIDIVRPTGVSHPRVTFTEGNGRKLQDTLHSNTLESLPRPWLVVEDADHEYETTIGVLRFFDEWLRPEEYLVVEDGIISDLIGDATCNSGPHRALKQFLSETCHAYEIDGRYCDFFGYNVTWCTNGFLKRLPGVPKDGSV